MKHYLKKLFFNLFEMEKLLLSRRPYKNVVAQIWPVSALKDGGVGQSL